MGVACRLVMAVALLAVWPCASRGALSLRIGANAGDAVDGFFLTAPGPHSLDLTFVETGPPEDEGLFSYDLSVRLVRPPGVTGGVRLVTGPDVFSTASPDFVFRPGDAPAVQVLEGDADHVRLSVTSGTDPPGGLADVHTGDTAGRLFFLVDAGAPSGPYRVVFESDTLFYSADPGRPLEVPVDLSDAGVIQVPEPAGCALLAAAAALVLSRRRRENPWLPPPRTAGRGTAH